MQIINGVTGINSAGFVMKFKVAWDGGETGWTGTFLNPGSKTIDLTTYNIPNGTQVWIVVHAELGKTKNGPKVQYSSTLPSTTNAKYLVTGAALTFSIALE